MIAHSISILQARGEGRLGNSEKQHNEKSADDVPFIGG